MVAALARLEGRITSADMLDLNKQVKIGKVPESQVAAEFLTRHLSPENHGAPGNHGCQNLAPHQGTSLFSVDFITHSNLDRHPPGDYCRQKTGLGQDNFGRYRESFRPFPPWPCWCS